METSWANPGIDLLLELGGSRRRAAIEGALRDAVRGGRLRAGTPLPSSRALAAELGVARNTVAGAYSQLVAEGWLDARQGSGTTVAPQRSSAPRSGLPREMSPRPLPRRLDLSPGRPDLAAFPRTTWMRASRRALAAAPNALLDYQDPRGPESLRTTLAQYLARVRGVLAAPEQIVVCSGFGQALGLLATALRGRGARSLAVESHGLGLHREIVRAAGLTPRPLTVDDSGARVEDLGDAGGVLLTPSHQFPLGVPLSAPRRAAVLAWARERGALIIEDDYDGEFRYDRRQIGALQGLAPELVAYVGTASKSLAPALGLAWVVVPAHLLRDVVEAKRLADGGTGVFEQLALEEFIRSGDLDHHVRRSRLRYRRRRDELVSVLAARRPEAVVKGIAAGLHAVVELPGVPASEEAAIRSRAARAGLTIQALGESRHEPDPDAAAAFVIGYGTPGDRLYSSALDVLCDVLG